MPLWLAADLLASEYLVAGGVCFRRRLVVHACRALFDRLWCFESSVHQILAHLLHISSEVLGSLMILMRCILNLGGILRLLQNMHAIGASCSDSWIHLARRG